MKKQNTGWISQAMSLFLINPLKLVSNGGEKVSEWEAGFHDFLEAEEQELLKTLEEAKAFDDASDKKMKKAIETWNKTFARS